MTLDVDRRQVLAYRLSAQGLHRDAGAVGELGVLDLGIQDTNVGSARLALAARLQPGFDDPTNDPAFRLLWSFRGAPHLHRTTDLVGLAGALWPLSDADALSRLAAERAALKAAGISGTSAFVAAAQVLRAVVTEPMAKGAVSAAVTAGLPGAYSYECRSCGATHVYGGLFQLVGVFAGVHLVPGRSVATLAPLDDRPPVPPAATGVADLIRAYLRLHGPTTLAQVAGYLGTKQTALRPGWPDDLVEVRLEGRRAWIPQDSVGALRAGPSGAVVRLLPPSDPYLQGRDRDLLVPDKSRQKAVWRILGNPGGVLVDGEIAGVWRARMNRKRLEVTVQPFDGFSAPVRSAIETEAETVAAARGGMELRVDFDEAGFVVDAGGRTPGGVA